MLALEKIKSTVVGLGLDCSLILFHLYYSVQKLYRFCAWCLFIKSYITAVFIDWTDNNITVDKADRSMKIRNIKGVFPPLHLWLLHQIGDQCLMAEGSTTGTPIINKTGASSACPSSLHKEGFKQKSSQTCTAAPFKMYGTEEDC